MSQLVADASLCGAWILEDESSEQAERLLRRIIDGKVDLLVPSLWHYEMSNLLRSAYRRKRLGKDQLEQSLEALERIPILHEDLPGAPARKRILHLAVQFDLSAYDAAYLELADRLKIPLLSADQKLRDAAIHLGLEGKI